MIKFLKAFAVALASAVILASCASTQVEDSEAGAKVKKIKYDKAAFDSAFVAGNYDVCLGMLATRKEDAVLNGVDTYMIQYLKKDYPSSGRQINQTQFDMSQVSNGMTAAKTVQAALAGENSVDYYGPTYERMLTYSMKAVNNLKAGSVPGAKGVMDDFTGNYKAEIADLIQQQKEADAANYDDNTRAVRESLAMANIRFDTSAIKSPEGSSKTYENSAFLSYLGTLVYSAYGDKTHASDFEKVLRNLNPNIDVSEDISVPKGKGRLDVIALTDLIGKRSEYSTGLIPVFNTNMINVNFKITYPVFLAQKHNISVSRVTLSNGLSKKFVLIEDFDKAVELDVLSRQKGAYNRSLTRNFIKNGTAVATASVALKRGGFPAQAAAIVVNKAMIKFVDMEKADVRQGAYFPNKASAAGFTVAPGTYSVVVEYSDGTKDEINNVVVEAGKPTIVISENMNKISVADNANAK